MKLQLDTTVSFHKLLDIMGDSILAKYNQIAQKASEVNASTFSRKEISFSLIYDCCQFMQKLIETNSFAVSYKWIDEYSSRKKRFGPRIHQVVLNFILDRFGAELKEKNRNETDCLLAKKLREYLRVFIPEIWERFEQNIDLPLKDRTKCPYGSSPPKEIGGVFVQKKKVKCNPSEGCALRNMISGEKKRARKLLEHLKEMSDNDELKTDELKKIQFFLEYFLDKEQHEKCFELCNQGIADLIIALETPKENTLVTTNKKESQVISPAIGQDCKILEK